MEYQKIINLSDNTPNQPSNFKTKNWGNLERTTLLVKLYLKLQR